jgi:transposase-like protein
MRWHLKAWTRDALRQELGLQGAKASQGMVGTLVRTIFEQPDHDSVWAQHARVVEQLTGCFDEAAHMLADAAEDLLAFSTFPPEHWSAIRSNNPQERLNKEIRRRTDVVGIFPNLASVVRLVGAVLAEQNDEWAVAIRYMGSESLAKARLRAIEGQALAASPEPALEQGAA